MFAKCLTCSCCTLGLKFQLHLLRSMIVMRPVESSTDFVCFKVFSSEAFCQLKLILPFLACFIAEPGLRKNGCCLLHMISLLGMGLLQMRLSSGQFVSTDINAVGPSIAEFPQLCAFTSHKCIDFPSSFFFFFTVSRVNVYILCQRQARCVVCAWRMFLAFFPAVTHNAFILKASLFAALAPIKIG